MPLFTPYRPHARALLRLGLPLIGSNLAQVLIGVTDAVMLGWYDVAALAAVTLAHSIWFVIFIVGSGFGFAVLPMVASALAAGDETQVRRVTRMGMWISALFALIVMPPLIWSEPVLRAMGQGETMAALARDYLAIAALGMLPALLVMVLKNYLAALERAQAVFWFTVVTALVNIAVNWLLIFGNLGFPELGLRGAAIASVSVHVSGLVAFCVYAARVTPEHALFARLWRPDREAFGRVFRLGWPIGLTNLAETGLFAATAVMMGWLGAVPLAAHGVALQLSSLTFVVHLGLSQAATVRAGAAAGRRDLPDLRTGARAAIGLSAGFAAVTVVVYLGLPELLVGLFVDPDDPARPQIVAVGAALMRVAALFQLVDGLQVVTLGLLRGLQDTRAPMVYAGLAYWAVGFPAGYVLGITLGFGGVGVWMGLVVGLGLAAASLLWRFWGEVRRREAAFAEP
ncbi:MATE family efflux transporter [Psychromarinibacter sp. C21-152]|uniref:Multidrug-efflux transporter n=1 Tax=Psychromarinibacter sediminicola TaxID=3033385 RepID=A0AAE3TAL0_9RHOB|nr:MATE family efflux transporter [Psychromarinibacter sediminicola]MDF0601735.1 MATE family efflux transporter [Psychromarinibacter sediminicola]